MVANIVVFNAGKQLLLDQAFAESEAGNEDYSCILFSNNITLTDPMTVANLTVCNFTGYANVSIPRSSFSPATISANVAYLLSSVVPVFTCTGGGGQTTYGWALLGASSGIAYLGQNFTSGHALTPGLSEVLYPFQIQLEDI